VLACQGRATLSRRVSHTALALQARALPFTWVNVAWESFVRFGGIRKRGYFSLFTDSRNFFNLFVKPEIQISRLKSQSPLPATRSSQHCGAQIKKLSKNPHSPFSRLNSPPAAAASSYAAERIAAAGSTSPSIRCATHSKPSLSPKPRARFGPVALRAKLSEASGFIPAFRFPLPDRLGLPVFSACFGCGVAFRPLFHLYCRCSLQLQFQGGGGGGAILLLRAAGRGASAS
jgi:hypothetical protein